MQVLRLTVPAILFAVILAGCIVQADTYSDQSPFSAPDTLQSSGGGSVEEASNDPHTPTPTPPPTPTPAPPAPTPTPPVPECENDNTDDECDHIDQARW